MNKETILPPGHHPHDPLVNDIDAVGYALEKVQTMLLWIDKHCSSFSSLRGPEPSEAESELGYLQDAIVQAMRHLDRLSELTLAGYTIDPAKRLPKGLQSSQGTIKRALRKDDNHE